MKKILTILATAVLFAAACTTIEDEPDFKGSVGGVVYADGKPLPTVSIAITPGGGSYITREDGAYMFEGLVPGDYTISFMKKGYEPLSKTFKVIAGSVTTGDVVMETTPNCLELDTQLLDFGTKTKMTSFTMTNIGVSQVTYNISKTSESPWLTLSETSGTIPSNGKVSISITVDRSVVVGQKASEILNIKSDTGQLLSVKVEVTAGKPATVDVVLEDLQATSVTIRFTPSENTYKYYVLVLPESEEPPTLEQMIQIGDCTTVKTQIVYTLDNLLPETKYVLYVAVFNEYEQVGDINGWSFETPKDVPLLEEYLGYWDATANYYSSGEAVSWSNIIIAPRTFQDSSNGIIVTGLGFGGTYTWFNALGLYDSESGVLHLYGNWYPTNTTFHYTSHPDRLLYSIFYPIYCNPATQTSAYIAADLNGNLLASLSLKADGTIKFEGGPYIDKNGRFANGFTYRIYYAEDYTEQGDDGQVIVHKKGEQLSRSGAYYNISMTPAKNPPTKSTADLLPVEAFAASFCGHAKDTPLELTPVRVGEQMESQE